MSKSKDTFTRVRVEAALLGRLIAMFDQSPRFVALLEGPDYRFSFANMAYQQLTGHRDVIGMSVREAFPDVEGQGYRTA